MDVLFNTQDLPIIYAPIIGGWVFNHGTEEDFASYLGVFREYIDEDCGTLPLSYSAWISKKGALVYYTNGDKSIGLSLMDRRGLYMSSIRLFSFSSSMEDNEIVDFLYEFLTKLNAPFYFSATKDTGRYNILTSLAEKLELKPISHYRGQFDYWRSI